MNTITINNVVYKLPTDERALSSVLNHLDMVKGGVKKFIKLHTLDDEAVKLGSTLLNSVIIKVNII